VVDRRPRAPGTRHPAVPPAAPRGARPARRRRGGRRPPEQRGPLGQPSSRPPPQAAPRQAGAPRAGTRRAGARPAGARPAAAPQAAALQAAARQAGLQQTGPQQPLGGPREGALPARRAAERRSGPTSAARRMAEGRPRNDPGVPAGRGAPGTPLLGRIRRRDPTGTGRVDRAPGP
jgi:hypothetical protein